MCRFQTSINKVLDDDKLSIFHTEQDVVVSCILIWIKEHKGLSHCLWSQFPASTLQGVHGQAFFCITKQKDMLKPFIKTFEMLYLYTV